MVKRIIVCLVLIIIIGLATGQGVDNEIIEFNMFDPHKLNSPRLKYAGEFRLTIYDDSTNSCGKWGKGKWRGFTAKYTPTAYGTIATDPEIIEPWTIVYIPILEGIFWATDVGEAIKGYDADVWIRKINEKYLIEFNKKGYYRADIYIINYPQCDKCKEVRINM